MTKYLWLILVLLSFSLSHRILADEVSEKTDGSFVGENPPKPINSSFVGDISNSMVNESWGKEDLSKKTDSGFVGDDAINAVNSYFAGDNSDRKEDQETNAPFAQEHSQVSKDGVFLGEDVHKKTIGTFAGDDYGK